MAQYRYFHNDQLKVDPTTGTKCRTGQLNHQFVEQKFVGGVWVGIDDADGVRYGDVAGAGCRFREGMRDGDYDVDMETEIAGFLLAEGDGWVNCGSVSGYWMPSKELAGESVNFWAKGRSGLTIPDAIGGNDIKILPACFRGNGITFYQSTATNLLSSDDWVFYFDIIVSGLTATCAFFGQNNSVQFDYLNSGNWYLKLTDGTHIREITIPVATLPLQNRKYTFKIVHLKTSTTKIYEGGIERGSTSGTFTNCIPDVLMFGSLNGAAIITNTTIITRAKIYGDAVESSLVAHYIFTGEFKVCDLSGNGNNLASYLYNVNVKSFNILADSYLLDNGWSLYQTVIGIIFDISLPFGGDPSLLIADGLYHYTLTESHLGSVTEINMAPCLIGFNETGSAAGALEIFDRSNITRQTAKSRASVYYDSTNLATKSRYHILEFYPYEIFNTLFENTYKDKVFPVISKIGNDISLTEFLSFATQKTGSNLTKVKNYCKIDIRAIVGHGGICFAFDDTERADSWIYADSILSKYGWKATFSIQTPNMNTTNQQDIDFIDLWRTKLQTLIYEGHELGNHTIRHQALNTYLAVPHTRQEYYDNMINPLQIILNSEMGIIPESFLYPSWYGHDAVMSNIILAEGFNTVRENTLTNPVNTSEICYNGTSQIITSLDIAPASGETHTDAEILLLLDYARDNNVILNILSHTITNLATGGIITVSIDRMKMICQYIIDNHMQFYTMNELRPEIFGL